MNTSAISALVIDRLGWVLLHSLWQFLALGVAALAVRRALRHSSSETRYAALLVAFSAMAVAPVATWLVRPQPVSVEKRRTSTGLHSPAVMQPVQHESFDAKASWPTPLAVEPSLAKSIHPNRHWWAADTWPAVERFVRPWQNTIIEIWCCGVLAFAIRPLAGWYTVRRLRRVGVAAVPADLQELLRRTAARLKLQESIDVWQSTLVQVPLVVGYLRPVILLPVSIVTNLPALQLEAILAHELAHIRRHDYLVNVVQTLVETVFFYHPAVWWLSRQIRDERENCCDDMAVTLLGSRVEYGHALLSVEELRGTTAVLAVGAAGGSLVTRVRRLVQVPPARRKSSSAWSAGAAVSSLALAIGVAVSLSVLAASQLPLDGAANNNELQSKVSADAKSGSDDSELGEGPPSLDIVIAKHVLLWEGKIVTWEQVVAGSQAIRKRQGVPVHPRFHVTKGAIELGHWDWYQAAARDAGKDIFEPAATNFRWMSYRASQHYDALRTQDDLASKPDRIRTGSVLDPSGKPQPGATIIAIPERSAVPVTLKPDFSRRSRAAREFRPHASMLAVNLRQDLSLRDPLDEIWTLTDQNGRFQISASDSGGVLLVLAPSGFALIPIPKPGELAEIRLKSYGELQISSSGKSPQEWSIQVFCPEVANTRIWFDIVGISLTEEPQVIRLPPGDVAVSRELAMDQGIKGAVPLEKFDLNAGARRQLRLSGVDPEDRPRSLITRPPANVNPARFSERALLSLDKPTNVEWSDLSLEDGLTYLSEFHGIPIHINADTLADAKISLADIPVTLKLDGVSLRSVLKLVLEPARLGFYIDAKGIAITTAAKAAGQSKPDHATGEPDAPKKDDVTPPDKSNEQGAIDEKTRSLDIVIAEHVLLWDGKIVTWDQAVEGLRGIRKQQGKPIHPNFKFTNGAIKAGRWDLYKAAAYEIYKELFEPAGMSIGSMSPRAGDRYDKIRTPADLIQKPEEVRMGIVRNAAGRPVTVATVVLLPEESIMPVMLEPNLSLRDPLDEVWVRTDNEGRFRIACPDTGYRLVVLSPAGFALAPVPKSGVEAEIKLQPHSELHLSSQTTASLEVAVSVHLPGMKEEHSGFSIYEIMVGFGAESKTLQLPPGKVTVSQSVKAHNGGKRHTPSDIFDLKPGEKKILSVGPEVEKGEEQGARALIIKIIAAKNGHIDSLWVGRTKLFNGPLDEEREQILDRRLRDVFLTIEGKPYDRVQIDASKNLQFASLKRIIDICSRQKTAAGEPVAQISFAEPWE